MTSKAKIRKKLLELYTERDKIVAKTGEEHITKNERIQAQIDILVWVLSDKHGELQI